MGESNDWFNGFNSSFLTDSVNDIFELKTLIGLT